MNYAWCIMIVGSYICAFINGRLPETTEAMLNGAKESVFILLSFAGIMCFWTGILKIGEEAGLLQIVETAFSPIIKRLFPDASKKACEAITANFSANVLGMGNAATPMGVKAMQLLDNENKTPHKISPSMAMLAIFNTSSVTFFPTTVISIRAAAGSSAPYDIIIPIWITSFATLMIGIVLVKLFFKK